MEEELLPEITDMSSMSSPLYPNPPYGIPPITGDLREQDPYEGVSDPLDLTLKFVRDDTGQTMESMIEKADLLPNCKRLLRGIWDHYTSQDYVLTNHYNEKTLRLRKLELKRSLLWLQAQTPSVNMISGDFNTICSIMIGRFSNKISRGAGGFERTHQGKQTIESISSRKEEIGQLEESGFSSFLGKYFNLNKRE